MGQAVLNGTFTALDEISPTIFLYIYWKITYWLSFKGGRIFEVIWVFVSSTWSSKITVTKEKRKSEEKERKRREKKNNGCALGRNTKKYIWHSVMKEEANSGSSL